MGELTSSRIEEISVNKLKEELWKYKNLKAIVSENDKEPSWDGFIYVYNKNGTEKKDDIEGRIPIQVKGKEVKRFNKKFNSFNIKSSDLNNYLNDGGVIFFVVEIKPDVTVKIFYKILLPVDLKAYLNKMEGKSNKSISIKINGDLQSDTNFAQKCKEFLKDKKLQSGVASYNLISINDIKNIKNKKMTIIHEKNPFDVVDKEVYLYMKDEFGALVPVDTKIKVEQVSCIVEEDLIFDGEKYFDNYKKTRIHDKYIIEFGEKITIDCNNDEMTIHNYDGNVLKRFYTVKYFIKISKEKYSMPIGEIEHLEEEYHFLERIINICNHFNVNLQNVKVSEITNNEYYFLPILEKIKERDYDFSLKSIEGKGEVSISKITFLKDYILVLKMEKKGVTVYADYFNIEDELTITTIIDTKEIEVNRLLFIEKDGLLASNYNEEIALKSIGKVDKENIIKMENDYILFALENIKAWDESGDSKYLNIAQYVFSLIDDPKIEDMIIINIAQIELRLNSYLSQKTTENLYKIKFKTDDISLKVAISILLADEKGFNDNFRLLGEEGKKEFISYPIYNLYLNKTMNKQV